MAVTPVLLAANQRPDLGGQITEVDGAPITKASVFIYSAGPKQGTSSLCPSCYPDCQKKSQTDDQGRFKIEALDPTLRFRLLVVAAGHESQFVPKVDPANGDQKIVLKRLSGELLTSNLRIKGLVLNEAGKAVPGAMISPEGIAMGDMTRWGGNDEEVEPLAVTDDDGRFILFCKTNTVDTVFGTAEGPGLAKQWITLKPGGDYLLRLLEGVTLTGQVLSQGQPVKGISVTAATTDRVCGRYFNCDAVTTDADGHFRLPNVPPNREFCLTSTMQSSPDQGTLPDKILTTGESGTVQDLGRMELQRAFSISGHVVLSDGKPVPPGTRLYLGRGQVMDSLESPLDAEGGFVFKGVPAGSVSMAVRINGYRLSKRNPSLDWLNGQILGRVAGDLGDFVIFMEPGNWEYNGQDDRPGGEDDYPVNKPLRSFTRK